jgi:hypothetical protein
MRLDPGAHVIVTEAPGAPASTARVVLAPADRQGLALVVLPKAASEGAVSPPANDAPAAGPATSWRLITGATLLGAGVVAAIAGAVSSAQVVSAQSVVDARRNTIPEPTSFDWCSPANTGTPGLPGYGLADACRKGSTFQVLEAVMYPLGAALLGTGIFLVVTRESAPASATSRLRVSPRVGATFAGLDASLRF